MYSALNVKKKKNNYRYIGRTIRERMDKSIVSKVIGTKVKFGIGVKKKKIRFSGRITQKSKKKI